MPLPSSGTLKASDIAAEFGVSVPYDLSDFYRGGAHVPNTAANVGIPTSGSMSMSDFYGAAATHTVSVSDVNVVGANGDLVSSSTATVTKGKGPFTYAWSWAADGAGITIDNPTSATTGLTSNGFNTFRGGTLQCSVTDTGNGSIVVIDTGTVSFQHGSPP